MEDRIVSEFNAVLGTQVDNISKGHELFDKYVKNLHEIEAKVSEKSINFNFVYILPVLKF